MICVLSIVTKCGYNNYLRKTMKQENTNVQVCLKYVISHWTINGLTQVLHLTLQSKLREEQRKYGIKKAFMKFQTKSCPIYHVASDQIFCLVTLLYQFPSSCHLFRLNDMPYYNVFFPTKIYAVLFIIFFTHYLTKKI